MQSPRDGFHQDDAESIRLLLKVLSEIECRLFKLGAHCNKGDDDAKEILILDNKYNICAICLNESNCTGATCEHCGVAKDNGAPSAIVIDSLKGANTCAVAKRTKSAS